MAPKRRFRLPFVRHPRDASRDYDDASYDGGVSDGGYMRHIVIVVVVLVVVGSVVRSLL